MNLLEFMRPACETLDLNVKAGLFGREGPSVLHMDVRDFAFDKDLVDLIYWWFLSAIFYGREA